MVCAKCEQLERASRKSTGLAVTDVWKPTGSGSDQRNERKIGGNKLLEARRRYAAPVPSSAPGRAIAATATARATAVGAGAGAAGASTGVGSSRRGAGAGASTASSQIPGKCLVCKVTVAKQGAIYCQKCAYKEGRCVKCGEKVLDTKQYKMSAK